MLRSLFLAFILGQSMTAIAHPESKTNAEALAEKVRCVAKINDNKARNLHFDQETQSLKTSDEGVNVSVTLAEIRSQLQASTSIDAKSSPQIITTGYSMIPSETESQEEYGQPAMMAVVDFGSDGKASVFCNLK